MDFISWTEALFISFLILLVFWAIGRSSEYTLENWLSALAKRTPTDLDDRIIVRAKKPIHHFIFFTGLYLATSRLPLKGTLNTVVDGSVFIAGVFIAAFLVYSIMDEIFRWYAEGVAKETESQLDDEFLPLIEKVAAIFIFIMALVAILKHFNQDIYLLVTVLGVGSLAIGLAAKDTLANMISGFTLMVDRPFRPGDRVELNSGEIGDVMDIGIRSTKIRTFFNTILVVPNSDLVNSRVINHSYPDAKVSGRIEVGVAYGTDIDKTKQVMIDAAFAVDEVLKDPEPKVYFTSFGDCSLNMLMAYWVDSYSIRFATQDKINMEINSRFEKEGIEIPFPIRTVINQPQQPVEEKPAAKKPKAKVKK